MIVRLKEKNPDFPDLTPEQPYFVIGIEADDYRILNDQGKPYLYPADLFETVDARSRAFGSLITGMTENAIRIRRS